MIPTTLLLRAVNSDPESENRMHSDEVAREFGFQGGLVPGVDVFEYMARAVVAAVPEWLSPDTQGCGELRLFRPYYDGETVQVHLDPEARKASADDRAVLTYSLGDPEQLTGEIPAFRSLPEVRPAASVESLAAGTVLGSLRRKLTNVAPGSLKARELLELANRILMQNVVLEPWIHTGSAMHWLTGLAALEEVEVRGEILAQNERKGHGIVTLRVVYCDAAAGARALRPCAWIDHTAIWRFQKPAQSSTR